MDNPVVGRLVVPLFNQQKVRVSSLRVVLQPSRHVNLPPNPLVCHRVFPLASPLACRPDNLRRGHRCGLLVNQQDSHHRTLRASHLANHLDNHRSNRLWCPLVSLVDNLSRDRRRNRRASHRTNQHDSRQRRQPDSLPNNRVLSPVGSPVDNLQCSPVSSPRRDRAGVLLYSQQTLLLLSQRQCRLGIHHSNPRNNRHGRHRCSHLQGHLRSLHWCPVEAQRCSQAPSRLVYHLIGRACNLLITHRVSQQDLLQFNLHASPRTSRRGSLPVAQHLSQYLVQVSIRPLSPVVCHLWLLRVSRHIALPRNQAMDHLLCQQVVPLVSPFRDQQRSHLAVPPCTHRDSHLYLRLCRPVRNPLRSLHCNQRRFPQRGLQCSRQRHHRPNLRRRLRENQRANRAFFHLFSHRPVHRDNRARSLLLRLVGSPLRSLRRLHPLSHRPVRRTMPCLLTPTSPVCSSSLLRVHPSQ